MLACLEVTQAEEDMQFGRVTDVLEGVLAQCGLYTTPKSQGIKPMKLTDELNRNPVAQNSEQTSNSREIGSSQSQVRVQSAEHHACLSDHAFQQLGQSVCTHPCQYRWCSVGPSRGSACGPLQRRLLFMCKGTVVYMAGSLCSLAHGAPRLADDAWASCYRPLHTFSAAYCLPKPYCLA